MMRANRYQPLPGAGHQQQLVTSHLLTAARAPAKTARWVTEPMPTITASGTHVGEVRAFLIKYYGKSTGQSVDDPPHSVTAKDTFGLESWFTANHIKSIDIGMRMLTAREL